MPVATVDGADTDRCDTLRIVEEFALIALVARFLENIYTLSLHDALPIYPNLAHLAIR